MDYSSWKNAGSYHFFLYPFVFRNKADLNELANQLTKEKVWRRVREIYSNQDSDAKKEAMRQYYSVRKYFNEQARMIAFGNQQADNIPVASFYLQAAKHGELHCTIDKENYELSIMRIRLNLYELGVGILIFELAAPDNKQYSFDEILIMNQAIRRVYPPFVAENIQGSLLPESMELWLYDNKKEEKKSILHVNTKKTCKDWKEGIVNPYEYEHGLPELLKEVICYGKNESQKDIIEDIFSRVQPVIDDRMHVVTLVKDNEIAKAMSLKKQDDFALYQDNELISALYALCYVDDKNLSKTCGNHVMQKKMLQDAVYDRWIERGTIQGITHHSMVCLTMKDSGLWQPVVLPFLTEYVEMQIIVLLQRASILYFSDLVATVSAKIDSYDFDGDVLQNETANEIFNLQLDFQKCKNQIMLDEVTAQEQGIELFDKMREAMGITKEIDSLNEKIEGLNQLALFDNGKKQEGQNQELNQYINNLTIWSILFAALALVISVIPVSDMNIFSILPEWILQYKNDDFVKKILLFLYIALPFAGTVLGVIIYPKVRSIRKRRKVLKKHRFRQNTGL